MWYRVSTRPSDKLHRVSVRVDDKLYEQLEYCAQRENKTMSDILLEAIQYRLDATHQYYDIPNILVQRLNQLIDQQQVMLHDMRSRDDAINASLSELVSLANGGNYLFDEVGE